MTGLSSPIGGIWGVHPSEVPDTTQRFPLGTRVRVTDAYWGERELIYLLNAAAAYVTGTVVTWAVGWVATAVPQATALVGYPCAATLTYTPASTYAWYVTAGKTPIYAVEDCDAGDPLYISATDGALQDTQVNGVQILRLQCAAAATTALTKRTQTTISSYKIVCDDVDGLFIGMYATGTGVGAGAATDLITAIGSDNHTVTLAGLNSATGFVTATFTMNDGTSYFPICHLERPLTQGQIA